MLLGQKPYHLSVYYGFSGGNTTFCLFEVRNGMCFCPCDLAGKISWLVMTCLEVCSAVLCFFFIFIKISIWHWPNCCYKETGARSRTLYDKQRALNFSHPVTLIVFADWREGNVFTGICRSVHNRPHGYSSLLRRGRYASYRKCFLVDSVFCL